jgi:hypothetical protein
MSGIIMYTILLKDFMCFRSGCAVEMESCERWDVGFPELCSSGISEAPGMSGRTLLSTTLLDACTGCAVEMGCGFPGVMQ